LRLAQVNDTPTYDLPKAGFLGPMKLLLTELHLDSYWSTSPFPKKKSWRKLCKRAVAARDLRLWQEWRLSKGDDNGWLHITKPTWGLEPYVTKLKGRALSLRAAFRLGVAEVGSTKIVKNTAPCRWCLTDTEETAQHVVLSCPVFAILRASFWESEEPPSPVNLSQAWTKIMSYSESSQDLLESIADAYYANFNIRIEGGAEEFMPDAATGTLSLDLCETAKWLIRGADDH
jgi:hypothetical protein